MIRQPIRSTKNGAGRYRDPGVPMPGPHRGLNSTARQWSHQLRYPPGCTAWRCLPPWARPPRVCIGEHRAPHSSSRQAFRHDERRRSIDPTATFEPDSRRRAVASKVQSRSHSPMFAGVRQRSAPHDLSLLALDGVGRQHADLESIWEQTFTSSNLVSAATSGRH